MALAGVNLTIKEGQKVALVGRTGSGKSSIVSLLLRLVPQAGGETLVSGQPLASRPLYSYRSTLAVVPQAT